MRLKVEEFRSTTRCLLIAVNTFQEAHPSALQSPEDDASKLASVLTSDLGAGIKPSQVELLVGRRATKDHVINRLKHLASTATSASRLFIFFAGHARTLEERTFLCVHGTDPEDPMTGITANDLDEAMAGSEAKGIMLAIDACSSGGLANTEGRWLRGKHEFRIILAATAEGEAAWELPDGASTLFTIHLTNALVGRERVGRESGVIYFSELLELLNTRMREEQESRYPGIHPQLPDFVCVYKKDPLLFLCHDPSRRKKYVDTVRLSRAHLRRVLLRVVWVGAFFLSLVTGVGYVVISKTWYVKLAGDTLGIYRGIEGVRAANLPVLYREPGIVASDLRNHSSMPVLYAFGNEGPAELLEDCASYLKPLAHVKILEAQGRLAEAEKVMLAELGKDNCDREIFEIVPEYTTPNNIEYVIQRARGTDDRCLALACLGALRHGRNDLVRVEISSAADKTAVHRSLTANLCDFSEQGNREYLEDLAASELGGVFFIPLLHRSIGLGSIISRDAFSAALKEHCLLFARSPILHGGPILAAYSELHPDAALIAAEVLAGLAKRGNEVQQRIAAMTLLSWLPARLVPLDLSAALKDSNPAVQHAARACAAAQYEKPRQVLGELRPNEWEVLLSLARRNLITGREVVDLAQSCDKPVLRWYCSILGSLKGSDSIAFLQDIATGRTPISDDIERDVLIAAVDALGKIGDTVSDPQELLAKYSRVDFRGEQDQRSIIYSWWMQTDRIAAVNHILEAMSTSGDAFTPFALSGVELSSDQIAVLLGMVDPNTAEGLRAVQGIAMGGTPEAIAGLLNSPFASVRTTTLFFLGGNVRLENCVEFLEAERSIPASYVLKLRTTLSHQEQIARVLNSPDWVREFLQISHSSVAVLDPGLGAYMSTVYRAQGWKQGQRE